MNEELQNNLDEVIMLHLEKIKSAGVSADKNTTLLVANVVKLYGLRQKDEETEEKYHDLRERRVYDNGRFDEDLRIKEHQAELDNERLELDQRKLDFEMQRYEDEKIAKAEDRALERERLRGARIEQTIKTVLAAAGLVFNAAVVESAVVLEEKGVIGSFFAKKVFTNFLNKADTKL